MVDTEQEQKNQEIVEALRKTLAALMKRLTPEIEPAVVYVLNDDLGNR